MRHAAALFLVLISLPIAWGEDHLAGGDWVAHGFAASAKTDLRDHLSRSVQAGEVPGGGLLIMHQGEVIFREGFGYGHLRRQVPFTADSTFRIASLSKPIIATLAVKLDAQGVIDLEATIDTYLPDMTNLRLQSGERPSRLPRLRECLKHTAGFVTDYDDGGRPWLQQTGKGLTLEQVVKLETNIPMSASPGQRFAYSGIGYDIVGRIIEVVTKRGLNEVLQRELCEPLGMTRTTYFPTADILDTMPSFYWQWRSDGNFRRRLDAPPVPATDYVSVGGGIVSTLDDLARFMLLHRNGGQLGDQPWASQWALTRMYARNKPGSYYGLGFTLGPPGDDGLASWIFHSGSSGTMMWWDRERDVIGILATQHSRSAGEKMAESQKRIPSDAPSWQVITKANYIDPIFGWTGNPVRGRAVVQQLDEAD